MLKTVKNPRCIAFLIAGVSLLAQGCAGHHTAHVHLAGGTLPGVSEDGTPYDAAMHVTTHVPLLPSEPRKCGASASFRLGGEEDYEKIITGNAGIKLELAC